MDVGEAVQRIIALAVCLAIGWGAAGTCSWWSTFGHDCRRGIWNRTMVGGRTGARTEMGLGKLETEREENLQPLQEAMCLL